MRWKSVIFKIIYGYAHIPQSINQKSNRALLHALCSGECFKLTRNSEVSCEKTHGGAGIHHVNHMIFTVDKTHHQLRIAGRRKITND